MSKVTPFQAALDIITANIKEYRDMEQMDGDRLVVILQQISGTLFYLEKEKAEFHIKYQTRLQELVKSKMPVNKAENQTEIDVPEMYLLRHITLSAYKVCDNIRSTISWLKTEKNKSETQK